MNSINAELFEKNILWFEKYSAENIDTEIDLNMNIIDDVSESTPLLRISNLFDYAILPDNKWEFYSDIAVKFPHVASVMVRSQYHIISDNFKWDILFDLEKLRAIIYNSITNALLEFRLICKKFDVELTDEMKDKDPEITDEMIIGVCENIIHEYNTLRKPYDLANENEITVIELICPSSSSISITLNLTFLVMEQILFNNLGFNRAQNRDAFFAIVPEMKFYTLRMKCIQIGKHEVKMTSEDVHYFLICMDCALQTLLGENGDLLTPVLESKNITVDVQNTWFKSAAELMKVCRQSVEDSIQRNEKFDWGTLIK